MIYAFASSPHAPLIFWKLHLSHAAMVGATDVAPTRGLHNNHSEGQSR